MRALVERCCGLDVHQDTVVACLLIGEPGKPLRQEVRMWATPTRALEALRDWLKSEKVTHVGMESTGVYWRPIYAVLDGHFVLIVGNLPGTRAIWRVRARSSSITRRSSSRLVAPLGRHGCRHRTADSVTALGRAEIHQGRRKTASSRLAEAQIREIARRPRACGHRLLPLGRETPVSNQRRIDTQYLINGRWQQ